MDGNWQVIATDVYADWFSAQSEYLQASITAYVRLLKISGPALGRPYADTLIGSRHPNMKELRVQHAGSPYRILLPLILYGKPLC